MKRSELTIIKTKELFDSLLVPLDGGRAIILYIKTLVAELLMMV